MRVLPQIVNAIVFITIGKDMVSLRASLLSIARSLTFSSALNPSSGQPLHSHVFTALFRKHCVVSRDSRCLIGTQDLRVDRRGRWD